MACGGSWSSSEDIKASESGVDRRAVPRFLFSSTAEVPEVWTFGILDFWPGGCCAIETAEAIPARSVSCEVTSPTVENTPARYNNAATLGL